MDKGRSVDAFSLLHPGSTPERLPAPVYSLDRRLNPLLSLQLTSEPVRHRNGCREGVTDLEVRPAVTPIATPPLAKVFPALPHAFFCRPAEVVAPELIGVR